MICSEIRPQLMDYAWQRLSASEAGAVDIHIGGCPECRAILEEERMLGQALATVPQVGPRTDVWETVRIRRMALEMSQSVAGLHPAVTAAARRTWSSWSVALTTGLAVVALMLAPTRSVPEPATGARVIAQTLEQARQVSQRSDDPLGDMSDKTWDALSGTGKEAS